MSAGSGLLTVPDPLMLTCSLTAQVIFLSQHDSEWAVFLYLWCSEALNNSWTNVLFFIYWGTFLHITVCRSYFMNVSFVVWICIWSYLVDIASSLTEAPCQLPWIGTIATARSHLICRSVLSLLPGNAKDKFSLVNWIALFTEGACWAVSVRTRES